MGRAGKSEHIAEIVTRYFICGLGAVEAIPVYFGRKYTRVRVHWADGKRWNVLCVPDFISGTSAVVPSAADRIRHWRMSLVKDDEPILAKVRENAVELSGKDGFPLSTYDLPAAA